MCGACSQYLKEITSKMDNILQVVNDNKVLLSKQEEEIKSLIKCVKIISASASEKSSENEKARVQKKKTYAEIAVKNVPPLIIEPKSKQNSGKTKNEIKEIINPSDLAVQINSVSNRVNGSIVIKCNNEESMKKMENEVKERCGEHYNVKVPKLVNPKIMVNAIDNEVDEDKLIEIILNQNKISGEMKLVKCFKKPSNISKYNAIIEVDKDLFKMLMDDDDPHLNIGWYKCQIFDKVNVKRCFKCWGFNHNAGNCTNQIRCPKCGGEHYIADCKNEKIECTNCTKTNSRLNLNLDVGHDSRDYKCPVYLRRLEKEKEKINY